MRGSCCFEKPGEISCEISVSYVGTGISQQIYPSGTIAGIQGEISCEMPVTSVSTAISQEISPLIFSQSGNLK